MLIHHLDRLNREVIWLASGSPRRREILEQVGLRFRVTASDYAEDLDKCLYTPAEYVVET
eukprot:CAMPEP_0177679736 /NCGR_PEP_ID=MMETSP0447-20121125/29768_1 /TAXON_ID=0 /ORGANISM="Stygamoeba regulata, Strain BSH-02190019" /LENGTH=59 /DNA_ID=CAMNT_0019188959 /DNA_START=17 /DNA_END=193 /DNA_ORIENTATION=+